jgi:hypothetical protein
MSPNRPSALPEPELGVVPPSRPTNRQRLERLVLLGPDLVCRAAASRASAPEERWMLTQPQAVRASYVSSVLDQEGDAELLSQMWILRQPRDVRESYVREILAPALRGF